MALRNQPYIPLYVQDVLTDEKLVECSALAHGIYFRLLCIMHKSEPYGTILLKQKDKQTESTCLNFATKLAKQMPFQIEEIKSGLNELISEGVLNLEGDSIYQKRMIRDNEISLKRSEAGKIGGVKTQFALANIKANIQANSEDEYENEIDIETKINKKEQKFKSEVYEFKQYPDAMLKEFISYWTEPNKSKTKMRYELQTTWDLARRLATWSRNDKNFNKDTKQVPAQKTYKSKNFDEFLKDPPDFIKNLTDKKTVKL
jgi:hypothetical protein